MPLKISPGEISSEIWGARTDPDVNYVVLPDTAPESPSSPSDD